MNATDRWLEDAAALRAAGTSFVLATVVAREAPQSARVGAHALVHADGRVEGWVGGGCVRPTLVREAKAALAERRPRLIRLNPAADPDPRSDVRVFALTCQGEGAVDIYLEPVLPAAVLVVLGATPVGRALARMAPEVGLRVTELDPASVPADDAGVARLEEQVREALTGAAERFLVVASMGEGDEEALEAAVRAAGGAYVGLVASRKKGESLLAYLRARGIPAEATGNVKAPAGLDFGAATPAEIALSILAEIVQARRGRGPGAARPAGGAGAAAGAMTSGKQAARRSLPLAMGPGAQAGAGATGAGVTAAAHGAPAAPGAVAVSDAAAVKDPVCGMTVDPATARHLHTLPDGRTFYFCCPHCRTAFEREPERYLTPVS